MIGNTHSYLEVLDKKTKGLRPQTNKQTSGVIVDIMHERHRRLIKLKAPLNNYVFEIIGTKMEEAARSFQGAVQKINFRDFYGKGN